MHAYGIGSHRSGQGTGRARSFRSLPLTPGRKYHYMAQAVWLEAGRWVGQSRKVLAQAGLFQSVYFWPKTTPPSNKHGGTPPALVRIHRHGYDELAVDPGPFLDVSQVALPVWEKAAEACKPNGIVI